MTRLRRQPLLALLALLAILPVLHGCPGAYNPFKQAVTAEQKAYALYGTYSIFTKKMADLVETGTLPSNVSLGLIEAESRATPVVNKLSEALDQAVEIAAEVAAGRTSQEKYAIAITNLNKWITEADPLIRNVVDAYKGAKR